MDRFDLSAFAIDRDDDGQADMLTVTADVSLVGAEVIVVGAGTYATATAALAALDTLVATVGNKDPGGDFLLVWESDRDGVMVSFVDPAAVTTNLTATSISDVVFLAGLTATNITDNLTAHNLIV